MLCVKSTGQFWIEGRGLVITFDSPFKMTYRELNALCCVSISIDGLIYRPAGFELNMKYGPISVGEPIGVLIGNWVSLGCNPRLQRKCIMSRGFIESATPYHSRDYVVSEAGLPVFLPDQQDEQVG